MRLAGLHVQADGEAKRSKLAARLGAAEAAAAEAHGHAEAAAADAAAATSLAEERRCQLATVMDSLAVVQASTCGSPALLQLLECHQLCHSPTLTPDNSRFHLDFLLVSPQQQQALIIIIKGHLRCRMGMAALVCSGCWS